MQKEVSKYQYKLQHLFNIEANRKVNIVVAPLYFPWKRNVINVESLHQQSTNKRNHSSSHKIAFVGCDNSKGLKIIQPPVSKEISGDSLRL